MSCLTCAITNPVPECVEQIVIGTISDVNEPIYIFIENTTTGRTTRYDEISDVSGLVTLDTSQIQFNQEFDYKIYITKQSSDSLLQELITIDGVASSCWVVPFIELLSDTNQKIAMPSITLEFCQ